MSFDAILSLFKPDFVFSLTFLVGFLGFGYFINNSFFPWLKGYMEKRLDIDEIRQRRWDTIIDVIADFKQELGAFRETHAIILAYLISDLTDNQPEKEGDSPAVRALKNRQTTQDLLLRRLEEKK
jgi:hypothetical protein